MTWFEGGHSHGLARWSSGLSDGWRLRHRTGIVARFVAEGARVGVLERVADRVEQLRTDFGNVVVAVQGDVTHLDDNKRAVEATVGAFGHLDTPVGNAGIFDNFLPLPDFPEDKLGEAFDELFAVNVKGYVLGAKAALPALQTTAGCMVFTASVAGLNSGGGGALYRLKACRCGVDSAASG